MGGAVVAENVVNPGRQWRLEALWNLGFGELGLGFEGFGVDISMIAGPRREGVVVWLVTGRGQMGLGR